MGKHTVHFSIFSKKGAFLNNIQGEIRKGRDLRQNLDSEKLKYPRDKRTCTLF